MDKVSVIIVNFNGKKFIKECVDSAIVSDFKNFEIIVIDNASTDGSFEYLKKIYGKKIKLIRSDKQLYFTGGSNLGAKNARGEKLIFLNSDCTVTPGWISELVSFLGENKKWLVQPKIMKSEKIIDGVGGKYSWFGKSAGLGNGEIDNGQYDKNFETDHINGTAFMIDRDFFWDLGGFDEGFRYEYEDVDLSLRAKKMGGKCFCVYKAVVYHKGSMTIKNNVKKPELLIRTGKNRLMTLAKHWRDNLVKTRERTVNLEGMAKARYEFAKKYISGKSVLDVGCGLGLGSNYLAQNGAREVLGIDYSKRAIEYANRVYQRDSLEFLLCDAADINSLGKKFDVITAFEVIEHLPKGTYRKFLIEVKDLLKKGGVFLISTPNILFASPNRSRPLNPFHAREYAAEEFKKEMKSVFKKCDFFGVSSSDIVFNKKKQELEKNFLYRFGVFFVRFKIFNILLAFIPWFNGVMGEPKAFKFSKNNLRSAECFLAICR